MKWSWYNAATACPHPPFYPVEKTTKITTELQMKTGSTVAAYTSFQEWTQNTLVNTDTATR